MDSIWSPNYSNNINFQVKWITFDLPMIVKISAYLCLCRVRKTNSSKLYSGQTTFVHLICLKGQKSLSSLCVDFWVQRVWFGLFWVHYVGFGLLMMVLCICLYENWVKMVICLSRSVYVEWDRGMLIKTHAWIWNG